MATGETQDDGAPRPGPPEARRWAIRCRPVDDGTAATARPAFAVAITDGATTIDIAHIGFIRRQAKHKATTFDKQLQQVLDVAQEAVHTINEFEDYLEELRQEQADMVRKRMEGIMGNLSTIPL